MKQITRIDINSPGEYQPFLTGWKQKDFQGIPLILGYRISDMAGGVLIADCMENMAVLKWITVDENCQRRGIGGRLWDAFCNIVEDAGITHVDALVCLSFEEAEKADVFLEHRGFRKKDSKESYSFSLGTVCRGVLSKMFKNKNIHIQSLYEVAAYQIRSYNQQISDLTVGEFMPIVPEELLPESVVWIEDEKIKGCALLASCGNGIELRMLSGNGSQMLALMLAKASENLAHKYSMDTKIYVAALVDSAKRLVEKLVGDSVVLESPVSHYVKEW